MSVWVVVICTTWYPHDPNVHEDRVFKKKYGAVLVHFYQVALLCTMSSLCPPQPIRFGQYTAWCIHYFAMLQYVWIEIINIMITAYLLSFTNDTCM